MNLVKTDIRILNISLLTDFFLFLDVSEKTMATYRRALKQLFVFFRKIISLHLHTIVSYYLRKS